MTFQARDQFPYQMLIFLHFKAYPLLTFFHSQRQWYIEWFFSLPATSAVYVGRQSGRYGFLKMQFPGSPAITIYAVSCSWLKASFVSLNLISIISSILPCWNALIPVWVISLSFTTSGALNSPRFILNISSHPPVSFNGLVVRRISGVSNRSSSFSDNK